MTRSTLLRVSLLPIVIPAAILASAYGMARLLAAIVLRGKTWADKKDKFDNWFGLTGPAMETPWKNLLAWRLAGGFGLLLHYLKDFATEWTRSDAQRAAKFFCLVWILTLIWGMF